MVARIRDACVNEGTFHTDASLGDVRHVLRGNIMVAVAGPVKEAFVGGCSILKLRILERNSGHTKAAVYSDAQLDIVTKVDNLMMATSL